MFLVHRFRNNDYTVDRSDYTFQVSFYTSVTDAGKQFREDLFLVAKLLACGRNMLHVAKLLKQPVSPTLPSSFAMVLPRGTTAKAPKTTCLKKIPPVIMMRAKEEVR